MYDEDIKSQSMSMSEKKSSGRNIEKVIELGSVYNNP
jgi:hypothetical protein